jgi:7,8-dihydro-6-hydroxymethylpterin dimethyltransferase
MENEKKCCCNLTDEEVVHDRQIEPFYKSGCMVCGDELVYDKIEITRTCYYCGETSSSNSSCIKDHFVCDKCHEADSIEIIRKTCFGSTETDAAKLMQLIRMHKAFSIHGPEHHSLVPAVILTVLRNNGHKITDAQIESAIQRGSSISGGACAFLGACGAAIGVGIAFSILLGANPLDAENRQKAQQATATALREISSINAARCCQRDSWIALTAFSKLVKETFDINFPVGGIHCQQHKQNKECIYNKCPLWKPTKTNSKVLYKTWSVCPICLKRLPAERVQVGKEVYLRKTCDEHGGFETIIWRGFSDIGEWIGNSDATPIDDPKCPDGCGLCSDHLQKTCCVILNVTNICNLNCTFCLADQCDSKGEPSFEEIKASLVRIIEKDKTLIQLSGGEPTTREDLPEIIKAAKEAGAKYVQLNSNGVRLGEDILMVKKLAEAGLSFVFMQFDGTEDAIHETIRGESLLKIKQQAIENCAAYNIGVTLVPTLVRGVNMHNIGDILKFAISKSPKVRGVHFQPATYMGRVPELPTDDERITLDELVYEIETQTSGMIKTENLLPSACDHPLCGFHGDFIVNPDNLFPLLKMGRTEKKCCCDSSPADLNRNFVAKRWERPSVESVGEDSGCGDIHDMEYFLKRSKTHGFTVTSMAFQDAANIDFSRLRKCSLHVYDNGNIVPFCSHFLTAWKQ